MKPRLRRLIRDAVIAALVVTLALLVRLAVNRWVNDQLILPTFVLATAIVSSLASIRAAVMASVLGAVYVIWFFVPPLYSLAVENKRQITVAMLGYCAVCGVVIVLGAVSALARARALRKQEQLEAEIARRSGVEQSLRSAEETSSQRAETLRAQEQLLQDLIDGSPESVVFLKDLEGRFITANGRLLQLLGLNRDELRGKTDHDLFPKERADSYRANDHTVAEAGRAMLFEEEAELLGERHVYLASKFPLRDGSGRIYGVGAISADITQRKRAESAVATANDRLERAQTAGRVGTFEWDLSTNRVVVTPGLEAIYGLKPGQMPDGYWLRYVHPDDLARMSENFQDIVAGRLGDAKYETEYRIVWPDGSVHWIEARGEVRCDALGRPVCIAGVNLDVTDRKRTEERLAQVARDAERRAAEIDAILEAIPHAVFFGGPNGIDRCNTEALRLMGASSLQDLQLRIRELDGQLRVRSHRDGGLVPPEQFPFNRALSGEMATLDTWATNVSTGEEVLIRANAAPVRIGDGIIGAVAVNIDITDQYRLQQRLREQEAHYRMLFEMSPTGVLLIDENGRILEFNEQLHLALGYTREEFARLTLADLDARETPAETRANLDRTLRTGAGINETVHRTRSGARIDVHVQARVVELAGEKRILVVWRDISERKRIEQTLREADSSKNQFLAVLSHELRNPLTPIRNSLYILARAAPGGDQARRAAATIERQVGHLTRLVDDLLDVTRITRGKMQLHRDRVNFADIVRRTVEDHRSVFAANGLELALEAPSDAQWVHGDPTRLAQVVGNLLQNAAKFCQRGGRTEVSLEREGDLATLRVRDDGRGIAPEVLPRLFQPFTQADASLDRSLGGLGLGLALTRGLIEMHGGQVDACSDGLGRGAEFVVRLPLESTSAALLQQVASTARQADGSARRVLIVEDNADAASSLREALELEGHLVALAHSGLDGIELARRFAPEVVLCDIGLPGMNGYEVARAMRADGQLRGAFLVALTGYATPDDVERAREAGFDRHLAKPPDIDALARLIALAPFDGQTSA